MIDDMLIGNTNLASRSRGKGGKIGAWALIGGFVGLLAVLILLRQAGIAQLAFLPLALMCGVILYLKNPIYHVSFTFWLFFLTPLMRRLIDFQTGWNPENTVMLAPYIVAIVPIFTLLKYIPRLNQEFLAPYVFLIFGLIYGFIIGIVSNSPAAAIFDLVRWMVPILFSLYIALGTLDYQELVRNIRSTFVWGGMVMGVYALFQYFLLPGWDVYWMQNSPISSIGLPQPQLVRVFSTMNSPGPFAATMVATLLMMVGVNHWTRWFASGPALAGLFFSLVRGAWFGGLIGFFWMVWRRKGLSRFKVLAVACFIALIFFPFTFLEFFSESFSTRVESISQFGNDNSYIARLAFYKDFLFISISDIVGTGLGSTGLASRLAVAGTSAPIGSFDSGIMILPYTLGWPGGIFYCIALVWILKNALGRFGNSDDILLTSQAIVISILSQIVLRNITSGAYGMIFWFFIGLCLISIQKKSKINEREIN